MLRLTHLFSHSVYHTDPWAALDIEAKWLLGPLPCMTNAYASCCHHSWAACRQGAMLQPHSLILGQVSLVKALINGQGLAQLGGATTELTVLEGTADSAFPEGAAKLPHGVQALQGL